MDYLSHLRGLKSAIASILYRHFNFKRSEMKYSKLGGLESSENLDVVIVDMMESEILNCDPATSCETSTDVSCSSEISTDMNLSIECANNSTENDLNSEISSTGNDNHESVLSEISNDSSVMDFSMNTHKISCTEDASVPYEQSIVSNAETERSECDKGTNDDNNCVTVQCNSTENNSNSDIILFNYKSDAPLKLVVNYHFHFDLDSDNTESEIQQTQSECPEQYDGDNRLCNVTDIQQTESESIEQDDADDSFFNVTTIKQTESKCMAQCNADDSLCNVTALSENSNELDFDEFVSGSDSFFDEDGFKVMNQSEIHGSKNNLLDASVDAEHHAAYTNKGLVDYDSEGEECDTDEDKGKHTVPVRTVKPFTPSMKKGFIYYSSVAQLYTGELRYEEILAEKKQGLVKKLFQKVFPSQKYVVN